MSPGEYVLERHRWHSSQLLHARGNGARGQFHFLWPNLKVNVYPGRPNLSIGPVWPEGPERSRGFLDYFFAPGEDESWIRDLLELDDQVGREDTALVERVQRGVRSGVLTEGRLLGESEQLIAHFDALVREALCLGSAAAPEPRRARRQLRPLPERPGRAEHVLRLEPHQLLGVELVERASGDAGETQRLRVQRLLEDRPRVAGVAEALPALRSVERPPQRRLRSLRQEVLALAREAPRDREQLVGRVVGEDDLAREPRPQARVRVEEAAPSGAGSPRRSRRAGGGSPPSA